MCSENILRHGEANQCFYQFSPRYCYALQVDAEALRSIVYDAPVLPWKPKGWVKVIQRIWREESPDGADCTQGHFALLSPRQSGIDMAKHGQSSSTAAGMKKLLDS